MAEYLIPSHCETAIIFERAIMLVLQPITIPFYYTVEISDADDFFINHCVDCSLRNNGCKKVGAINTQCRLGNYSQTTSETRCIQMALPQHMMVFAEYQNETPKFAYEVGSHLRPLRLGNIGSGGSWCNGNVNYNAIDPLNIYNAYTRSLHNKDLTGKDDDDKYESYLQEVSSDFSKIVGGYELDVTDYGDVQNVVYTPTSVIWDSHASTDENYYAIKGKGYAKVQ